MTDNDNSCWLLITFEKNCTTSSWYMKSINSQLPINLEQFKWFEEDRIQNLAVLPWVHYEAGCRGAPAESFVHNFLLVCYYDTLKEFKAHVAVRLSLSRVTIIECGWDRLCWSQYTYHCNQWADLCVLLSFNKR